jgi:hypothetical protein
MRKILLALLLFTSSCDYQPIYVEKKITKVKFLEIVSEGENRINSRIINSLSFEEDKSGESLNKLLLKTAYIINETSKNSRGQIQSYRSSILVNLTISKDNKIIKRKDFLKDFTYNSRDNKFELVEYQETVKNNIVNKIIEEITLYINLQ